MTTIGMAPSTAALYEPFLSAPASNGGPARQAAILAGVTSGRVHLLKSGATTRR